MKTKKFTKRFFSILFITGLILSCSSEDGEDGAIGPQGQQGEQGPAGAAGEDGAQGDQGDQGDPGTANVIYSDWFDTELGGDIAASNESFTIAAPEIDADMLDFGTVLVYGRRDVPAIVYQLPIVFGAARQQSYFFSATAQEIRISVHATDLGGDVGNGAFIEQYRYVLIPGGASTSGKSTTSKDYSKMTYEEIVALFNIPE